MKISSFPKKFILVLIRFYKREISPMLRLDASETVTPEDDAKPWLDDFVAALQTQE